MKIGDDTAIGVRSQYQRLLEPGEAVFDEGDPGDQLYIIQSGEIELTRDSGAGHRIVAHLVSGDFFGELGVVLGQARTTRAVAVTRTRLLALDRDTLEGMCLEQPEIAIRMIRVLVSRLIEAERRLASLGVDDLRRPVIRALVRHGEAREEGGLSIPLTLRGIADEAGLSLLEAHRALHNLFDRKLAQLSGEELSVPDVDALSACLDNPE